jgi:menaquinone C8-methyltransferase
MLKKIIQNATIYSAKKIMSDAMDTNLDIQNVHYPIQRQFDKTKKYLLYIHIPFCHTFCPFCSFHKFKYEEDLAKKYFKFLRMELRKVHNEGFHFDSLYVGGGTTLINEEELIKTLSLAKKLFDIKEISCESDPNHISPDSLNKFVGLIDRLSVGVQSFDDTILKRVARYDKFGSGKEVAKKLEFMQKYIPNTNVDLIFNFPMQTKQMLEKDLHIAKNLELSQITTYPLMSSKITRQKMLNAFDEKTNDSEFEFYSIIKEQLKEYQTNNAWSFSKIKTKLNDEYVGSHDEYIGIGSGAFSFLNGNLYINAFDLDTYADLVTKQPHAIVAQSSFNKKAQLKYHFLTALFNGKIDIKQFNENFNTNLQKVLGQELYMLKRSHAICISQNTLTTTKFGSYLALCMMKEFYAGMDKVRAMFKQRLYALAV